MNIIAPRSNTQATTPMPTPSPALAAGVRLVLLGGGLGGGVAEDRVLVEGEGGEGVGEGILESDESC